MARGRAISREIREALWTANKQGTPIFKAVYKSHSVSRASAYHLVQGRPHLAPKPHAAGRAGSFIEDIMHFIVMKIRESPTLTLHELITSAMSAGCPEIHPAHFIVTWPTG
jgi:hypothetical protein